MHAARPEWNAYVCPQRYVGLSVRSDAEVVAPLTITRDDAAALTLVGVPDNPNSAHASLLPGRSYTVQFAGAAPLRPRISLSRTEEGEWARLTLPYPQAALRVIRDFNSIHPLRRGRRPRGAGGEHRRPVLVRHGHRHAAPEDRDPDRTDFGDDSGGADVGSQPERSDGDRLGDPRSARDDPAVVSPPAPPTFAFSMISDSTTLERIRTVIVPDHDELGRVVAGRIAALVRAKAAAGKPAVLGLATGSTPVGVYRELVRLHREEGLSFAHVITFNLDEYYPMDPGSLHSYHRFMWENLFSQLDILRENVHIPRGDVPRDRVDEECRRYEAAIRAAGGIDLQLLGIGRTGHIGFNEPGSGLESRTRLDHARPGHPQGRRGATSSARRTCPARRSRWAWPPSSRRGRS